MVLAQFIFSDQWRLVVPVSSPPVFAGRRALPVPSVGCSKFSTPQPSPATCCISHEPAGSSTAPRALMGMRASDRDREQVVRLLREHYSAGRLSDVELDERVEHAYGARTVAELESITLDLPSPELALPATRR